MPFADRFEDGDARDYLRELINHDALEGPALGIAKLVIDRGPGALSEKQAYVFEQSVSDYVVPACNGCGAPIPWSEMYAATDNGKLCSWCWHMRENARES